MDNKTKEKMSPEEEKANDWGRQQGRSPTDPKIMLLC